MAGISGEGRTAGAGPGPWGPPAPTLSPRKAARKRVPRRLDESMTLLREVMERPLDPGYAEAARRKASGAPARGRPLTLVIAVVVGLATTWSVLVLRAPAPAAVKARDLLVKQIEARTKANDEAKARIDDYRATVRRAQNRALTQGGDPTAAATAAALGVASGDVAVTGPGLVVTLDDAPGSGSGGGTNGDPRGDQADDDGRVLDRDLQTVVNGLWAAGAEAISVNDQRLTALSAIRSAGEAILVDYRPLVPPYTITAIGDPATLQTSFAASSAGAYAQSLSDNFGIKVGYRPGQDLEVKAAGALGLRRAVPVDTATATTGSSTATSVVSDVAASPGTDGSGGPLPSSASSSGSSPSEAAP